MRKRACHCCSGSGKEIDPRAVGEEMLALRLKSRITQRAVADHMNFTSAYVSDLEKGKRLWRDELMELYQKAVKDLS